jgi:hypothetical protein
MQPEVNLSQMMQDQDSNSHHRQEELARSGEQSFFFFRSRRGELKGERENYLGSE